jgi:hypothetical protein
MPLVTRQTVIVSPETLSHVFDMGLFQFPLRNVALAAKGLIRVNSREPHNPVQVDEKAAALGTRFSLFISGDLAFGTESISRERHRMFAFTFIGTFGLLAMTASASWVCEALFQKRLVFLLWDATLLPESFAPHVAVKAVPSFQRLMHGPGSGTLAVTFYASMLGR